MLQAWLDQKQEERYQLASGGARNVELGVRGAHISAFSSPVLVSSEGIRIMSCLGGRKLLLRALREKRVDRAELAHHSSSSAVL